MKASRKRKQGDTSPFMYHIELEDQEPQMPEWSPRTPGRHNIKQEISSMGYQPSMYYPMISHLPTSMQRPMPRFMPQGTGAVPRSARIPSPYSMMPAMAYDNNFVMSPNQEPLFPMNQYLAPISSDADQKDLNSFDDLWNSDFTKYESFEGLLKGDSSSADYACDIAETHPQLPELEQTIERTRVEAAATVNSKPYQPALPFELEDVHGDETPALTADVGTMAPPHSQFALSASAAAAILPYETVAVAQNDPKPVNQERKASLMVVSL